MVREWNGPAVLPRREYCWDAASVEWSTAISNNQA
jgi:hypothetical protein